MQTFYNTPPNNYKSFSERAYTFQVKDYFKILNLRKFRPEFLQKSDATDEHGFLRNEGF